jgi:hypothetical protein
MPFDGTDFQAPTALDTGLFPIWSKHSCRNWIEARFHWGRRGDKGQVVLRVLPPADREATIILLLQHAKGLIEDPKNWTRGTYRSLSGRHCAVGALRAVAACLKSPSPAWSAHEFLIRVARLRGFTSVEAMNDHSSHAEVLGAFDEAIALAESATLA